MSSTFLLLVLAVALPGCAAFSGGASTGVTGSYEGTLTTPDFTLQMTMTAAEDTSGRVTGTADLFRGDIVIAYEVSGTRSGDALNLAFDGPGDDLVLQTAVSDGGRRLTGTATGGDLVNAAITLTR